MPKPPIVRGIVLIAVGLTCLAGERLSPCRLSGDIVIERAGLRIHVPLMASPLLRVVLSLLLWLLGR